MRSAAVLGSFLATSVILASAAHAGVVVNPVLSSLSMSSANGSVAYSASINQQSGTGDTGVLFGRFGMNAQIRGRWSAQMVGAAGAGANGGNVYSITVQIGSIVQVGSVAEAYAEAIVQPTDRIAGSMITSASIGFGVGGGGLRFDDFGGQNRLIIDNTGAFGDARYAMQVTPDFDAMGSTGDPALMPTYASIAGDGSVGFATTFSASSMWGGSYNWSSTFNGNLAEWEVRGFNSSFFVEVVSVPAPGAAALLGLAGVVGRRRR
ncbi:MAG: hypothetical protein NTU45_05470 [Planctomycetota bacterium]|nr:hypothetical protein [Planctomycetota bacterium]